MENGTPEYLESGYKPEPVFLEDVVYAKALDTFVIACVDFVITCQGQIFLGKRARRPQADWWIFGGRMRAGEHLQETAARIIKTETGIAASSERFSHLATFICGWRERAQALMGNGVHTLSTVLTIEISPEEKQAVSTNDEYSQTRWVTPTEIDDSYHPALHYIAQQLTK